MLRFMAPSMTSRTPLLQLPKTTRSLPPIYPHTRALHTVSKQKTALLGGIRILTTARQTPGQNHVFLSPFKSSGQFRAYNNNSNCDDCTNCTNCTNCDDCSNCTNCTNCDDCTNCTDCTNCDDCTNCTDCSDCDGLTNACGVKGVKAQVLKRKGAEYQSDATVSSSQSQDAGNNRVISGADADISNMIPKSSGWGKRVTSGDNKRHESHIGNTKGWSRNISRYFSSARHEQGEIHNTNCTNCKDCTDCKNCTNCTNCANSTDCTDCANLYNARGLQGVRASRLSWWGNYRVSVPTPDGGREAMGMSGFSFNISDFDGRSLGADSGLVQVGDGIYFHGQRVVLNDGLARAGRFWKLKGWVVVGGVVVLMVWRSRRRARDERTEAGS
ncbi:hypothetical protein G7Y79_00014g037400 [Physcia stellaris]|nr:hypothetical protein G7Y79_00014g037400 [Physcia stellaris]